MDEGCTECGMDAPIQNLIKKKEREQEQLLTGGAIDLCGDICKVVGGEGWEAGGAVDY